MHLVTFFEADKARIGIFDKENNEIVDLQQASVDLPADMLGFIAAGEEALRRAHTVAKSGAGRIALERVQLMAPIPRPQRNIFCIGKNYRAHVQELRETAPALAGNTGTNQPEKPIFFTKATTTVIGPNVAIPASLDTSATTDYEGELAVIIARDGRGIKAEDAMAYVYGYTIINDVTSRRIQGDHQQWFLGKSLDGYCPMGPAIVTVDEVPDVRQLQLKTWVDGELRQDDVISNMIFDIPTQIETLSRGMTLKTGDILATGTPAGVGMGFKPPRYLTPGDSVSVTIEPIGTLENPVA